MKAVYALYSNGRDAQRAVNNLRQAGISDSEITIITGEPMGEFEFSHIGHKNPLWWIACGGGLAGMLFSAWMTQFIEKAWPMNVGNMSTVAWWPNLIIIFELTMLGAILSTVGTLMVSGGLLRRRPALYDPEVTNGKILVGLENPGDGRMADLERALLSAPDISLKTV